MAALEALLDRNKFGSQEPFARNNQIDFLEAGWAYRIGQGDFRDVVTSDAIFAVVNGVPPDEGVMVELGMQPNLAIALKKPIVLVLGMTISAALSEEAEQYPLNLMLFTETISAALSKS